VLASSERSHGQRAVGSFLLLVLQKAIKLCLENIIELVVPPNTIVGHNMPFRYMSSPDMTPYLRRLEVVLHNRARRHVHLLGIQEVVQADVTAVVTTARSKRYKGNRVKSVSDIGTIC